MRCSIAVVPGLLIFGSAAGAQPPGECPPGYIARPAIEEDEAPPVLRRGVPNARQEEETTGSVACVRAETPVQNDFLDEVRSKVDEFSAGLPNFLCEQAVSRFESRSSPARWKPQDRLSAEILMVDGKESYRNVRRNGKPVRPGEETSSGQWSRGEFSSLLQDLFSPNTRADFQFKSDTDLDGVATRHYAYEVAQPSSHWKIDFGDHVFFPRYRGAVWINPETFRVLRVELEAVDLPADYPMDVIEMSVDYGPVKIGDSEFLLPVRSANLACQRHSRVCAKNEIEFREYRLFTAESTITTTDSTIEYKGPVQK